MAIPSQIAEAYYEAYYRENRWGTGLGGTRAPVRNGVGRHARPGGRAYIEGMDSLRSEIRKPGEGRR